MQMLPQYSERKGKRQYERDTLWSGGVRTTFCFGFDPNRVGTAGWMRRPSPSNYEEWKISEDDLAFLQQMAWETASVYEEERE